MRKRRAVKAKAGAVALKVRWGFIIRVLCPRQVIYVSFRGNQRW